MSDPVRELQQIFDKVVDLAPEERARRLTELCGEDRELRAEVEQLLAALERSSRAHGIVRPISPAYAASALDAESDSMVPAAFGPYRSIRSLGEGGYGLVYLAERTEPFRQLVAIKVLKPGLDTRAILSRFDHERRALALLSHPAIAKILDAGETEQGRPYFAMEYVEGVSLSKFCREHNPPIPTRIKLLVEVAAAIQYAHSKGVIHRDLKPGNILVAGAPDRPRPVVIDFGIAKIAEATAGPSLTLEGRGPLGTPEYMSPEQFSIEAGEIDTRTDVYALGAVLYELISDRPPAYQTALEGRSTESIARLICESEPIFPAPSSNALHGTRSTAASARLTRELGWIAMEALRREPDRRYQSPAEFAADLVACLSGLPVSAGPDSRTYRLRKLAARNKGPVAAVLIGVFSLIAVSVMQLRAARQERSLRLVTDDALKQATRRGVELEEANRQLRRQRTLANLAAAAAHIEVGDATAAQQRLLSIPPDERPWEWRLLAAESDRAESRARPFRNNIEELSLNPDGRLLAAAATYEDIRVLDSTTLETVAILPGFAGQQSIACAFHPREPVLIVGAWDGRLRSYSAESFEVVRESSTVPIDDLLVSTDGSLIAFRDARDNRVVLCEYPSLKERTRFGDEVRGLAFLPESRNIVTVGAGRACVHDESGRLVRHAVIPDGFADVCVSSSGARMATMSDQAIVLETSALRTTARVSAVSRFITGAFVCGDRWIAGGGVDAALRLIDPASGIVSHRLLCPGRGVFVGPQSADGRTLFTGSYDGQVHRWSLTELGFAQRDSEPPISVSIRSDGNALALIAPHGGRVSILRSQDLGTSAELQSGLSRVSAAEFVHERNTLIASGVGGTVSIDVDSKHVRTIEVPGGVAHDSALAARPNSNEVLIGSPGGSAWRIDAASLRTVPLSSSGASLGLPLAVGPTGRLAVCADIGVARVVDIERGAVVCTLPENTNDRVNCAAVSPDDRFAAIGSWDSKLQVWRIADTTLIADLELDSAPLSVGFMADGDSLVVTDVAGYLRVWSTRDFASTLVMRAGRSWLGSRVHPDQQRLLTFESLAPATIRWWPAHSNRSTPETDWPR
ncbi:MAG: protein kinase [Phycisphaerales bacterium]|nr:protein kinase [Phycisphaerales bacterium]